jgi:N-acetylglucosaminyl-diphospho-decaprenol L-rhamnosyltransferase
MVDIVIVNWDSGDFLYKCIQSVFIETNKIVIGKIFIIDNNSSDDSLKKINQDNKIFIIQNNKNNGFSKACNQGFKLCTSPYLLLLNPDAQLSSTTLIECIAFMDKNLDVDILGCQLLNDNGNVTSSCARFPTPLRYFYDSLGLSKIAPKIFNPSVLMTDWDHKASRKVDQVIGAFMFMRNSIFQKLGYFDERFFVYYEELDFSKRLAQLGGTSFYNSDIKAIHSGGGSTNNVKSFRLFLNLRSKLQYAKKHFNSFGYSVIWCCTFFIEPFTRNIFLLLKGNFKETKNVFKAYGLLIKNNKK